MSGLGGKYFVGGYIDERWLRLGVIWDSLELGSMGVRSRRLSIREDEKKKRVIFWSGSWLFYWVLIGKRFFEGW